MIALSDGHLVTRAQRRSQNYINVYDLNTAKLVTTHACQTGSNVTCARISMDGRQLYAAMSNLTLCIYAGPGFIDLVMTSLPDNHVGGRCYAVCALTTSVANDAVVMRFYDDGPVGGAARCVFSASRLFVSRLPSKLL